MKTAFISPLRYPGGKAKLGPYFARLLSEQSVAINSYAEPYAGGAGAGLYLLSEGHIDSLLINDLNPGIAAFWRAVLYRTDEFVERINEQDVSLEYWHRCRIIYEAQTSADEFELGFATFFLNRCNRSGILTARPIGGLEQAGKWKIDARFNRRDLSARVRYIAGLADKIAITSLSAIDFLRKQSRRAEAMLLYVDPPYLVKGDELYMTAHSWDDHAELASVLNEIRHPWVLTYDVDDRVRRLYPANRCLQYSISHTAQSQKVGRELMLFSKGLRVHDVAVSSNRQGAWI